MNIVECYRLKQKKADLAYNSDTTYAGYKPGSLVREPKEPGDPEDGDYGDPILASAEKGEKALKIMTQQWLKRIRAFAKSPVRTS